MLYEELEKVAPPLASFFKKVAPQLTEDEISVRKPKSIPKSRQFVGRCYLFSYKNPMGKGTPELPYHHIYPMVINLEHRRDTMLGLNPFYLGPDQRADFINNLLSRLVGSESDPDSRCRITYAMIAKYRRSFRTAFPCIKQYKFSRMSPIVIEMKPDLWKEFYLGETSKRHELFFRGGSPKRVWSDSKIMSKQMGRDRRRK